MKIQRPAVFSLLLLSLGGTIFLSQAHPLLSQAASPGPPPAKVRGDRTQLLQNLDLTQEQLEQLQTVRQRYQNQISQNAQALRQARQELQGLMAGTSPESEIRRKFRQVQSLDQRVDELRFESMLAMRQVLTPEQRRQVAQEFQNRRQRIRDRPGRQNRSAAPF